MSSLKVQGINEQEKEVVWPQVLAIFTAALSSLTCGILFNWPSPTIPILVSDEYPYDISLDEATYLTVIPAIALIVFSPISGTLMDLIGRRKTLLFVAVPQAITWILTAIGGPIYIFYAAKVTNGLADAFGFAVLPAYISEVSTPKVRGSWGNAITFFGYSGNLFMNVVGVCFSVRTSALIFLTIPIVFFIGTIFMPETPYYLLMKNREDEAKKSLQWLRGKEHVDEEFKQLTADVKRQLSEPGRLKDIYLIDSNRRALLIGILIRGMQQFSGLSAIAMYCQLIFQMAGGNLSPVLSVVILCVAILIVNVCASVILDKIGRRIAMMISCFGSGLSLLLLASYLYLSITFNIEALNFFPTLLLLIYVIFFCLGLGIVPTLMLGEIFSSSIKGKVLCIMNMFFGLYLCASSKIFSLLFFNFGLYVPFIFFGIVCLLSGIASFFFVPETKGKTLEEIQQSLKNKTKK